MDEMLRKEDVLKALSAKIDELEKRDAKADVILGLVTAMSVVKLMEGEPAEKQEPCDDAISRQAVLDVISNEKYHYWAIFEYVKQLPPVTSAEKVGHWLYTGDYITEGMLKCSKCGFEHDVSERFSYCPNCGAKMQEVEE